MNSGLVRSTCGLCFVGCGILIRIEDGKPVKIEGDPNCPVNESVLCVKGRASLEYLYHRARLIHPLKRTGARGEGKWQRISWDEAIETIANQMAIARTKHGPESVALIMGYAKGYQNTWLHRFGNAFGTPNVVGMGHLCTQPRSFASRITFGFSPVFDSSYPASCLIVWGTNPRDTNLPLYRRLLRVLETGKTKLIVIDPYKIDLAERADIWLRPRPGSDLALALGMIHVIIKEKLYDVEFVREWTVGFEELADHVKKYSPEKVSSVTRISAGKIEEAARVYSSEKPANILWGNALDQTINSFQTARAISILRAITGNLDIPGGEVELSTLPILWWASPELELRDMLPKSRWDMRIDGDLKLLPFFRYVLPQSLIKAILEEKPYPVRVVYLAGCNPLLTYSNAHRVFAALQKVDFLAVADLFMTPTAAMADVVVPVTSYLECDNIVSPTNTIAQVQQKVASLGECKCDYEIVSGLSHRLGLAEYFWQSLEHALDAILGPAGISFQEFKKIVIIGGVKLYRKYLKKGFATASGKVELFSKQLKDWGFDPLPLYREMAETSSVDNEILEEYPLMLTNSKSAYYQHSGGRQIECLRRHHPEPKIKIHPATATRIGVSEGDCVWVETERGRIKQKVCLTSGLDRNIVMTDYGWWYPERVADSVFGWDDSNINVLTDDAPPFGKEMGSPNLRGIFCKVYPVK